MRLQFAYDAYHAQLRHLLGQSQLKYGKSYLIDLHGFNAERSGIDADLVFGSANGATTPDGLDRSAIDFFKARGFCVKLAQIGEKFSGGYIVRWHSDHCTSALQIEVTSRIRTEESLKEGTYLSAKLREFVLSLH
jgi:N-formylglutamate amidohydrolase